MESTCRPPKLIADTTSTIPLKMCKTFDNDPIVREVEEGEHQGTIDHKWVQVFHYNLEFGIIELGYYISGRQTEGMRRKLDALAWGKQTRGTS